jgi:hypothetical protein
VISSVEGFPGFIQVSRQGYQEGKLVSSGGDDWQKPAISQQVAGGVGQVGGKTDMESGRSDGKTDTVSGRCHTAFLVPGARKPAPLLIGGECESLPAHQRAPSFLTPTYPHTTLGAGKYGLPRSTATLYPASVQWTAVNLCTPATVPPNHTRCAHVSASSAGQVQVSVRAHTLALPRYALFSLRKYPLRRIPL